MMPELILLAAIAAATTADTSRYAPPPTAEARRSIEDLDEPGPEAIFTYRVDGRCRVDDPRLLQGPDSILWRDAEEVFDITGESTVFRFIDGRRTQLRERRVRLLGELVREGELVCHVRPSGEVVNAWIERRDDSIARRQAPRRDPVAIRGGRVGDLGTFSVAFEVAPADADGAAAPTSTERP